MSATAADRRIRSLRGPKPPVDAWTAHGSVVEDERRSDGSVERALTIFLAGAECPFTCAFCDLWRYTIDGPTPIGALPRQIEATLGEREGQRIDRVKLYNASNFFDRRAVPLEDLPRIAELCAPFGGVTVESHANTVGAAALDFAERLDGRLEVAIGLETIHAAAMMHLNKRLELDRFERAAAFLTEHGIDLRAFVLLGAPGTPREDVVGSAVESAEYAVARGASVVSIIPVRGGNGEMERLAAQGLFTPPTLRQLEQALESCVGSSNAAITVDLWDLDRLAACPACRAARVARLHRINLSGAAEPPVACAECGGA